MLSRAMFFLSLIALLGPLQAEGQEPAQVAGADPASVASWQYEIDQQIEALNSAYGLDSDVSTSLRQEMQTRLIAQVQFDQNEMAALVAEAQAQQGSGVESVDLTPKLLELTSRMPLNDEQVANWLESRLPQEVVPQGRQRWQELREMRMKETQAAELDLRRAPGIKVEINQGIAESFADVSPVETNPLPGGEKEERVFPQISERARNEGIVVPDSAALSAVAPQPHTKAALAQDQAKLAALESASPAAAKRAKLDEQQKLIEQPPAPQVRVQIDEPPPSAPPVKHTRQDPTIVQRPVTQPPQPEAKPVVLAAAPPLDDWEKYVQGLCKKYDFNEAQKTNALSILKDLKRRANQYRLSRADQYAAAELKTDAKTRGDSMKDLNRPIDALFDELKNRLESLPTIEQRERAKDPNAKRERGA